MSKSDKIRVAEFFSQGEFEKTFPHLSDNIVWTVEGESTTEGIDSVTEKCRQVSAYFDSVTTDFLTKRVTVADDLVFVEGTAEFIRDGIKIASVSACDVYRFGKDNKIEEIISYCIQKK